MPDPTTPVVGSSPTETPAAPEFDMAAYAASRDAERSGKPVEPSNPSATAADQPANQAGEIAPSQTPASEPGTPSGHKGNAETRKAQLQAEIDALLKQRAELRREPPVDGKPASEPAPRAKRGFTKAELEEAIRFAREPIGPNEPQLADFEADPVKYPDPYAAYLRAVARFDAKHEAEATLSAAQEKAAAVTAQAELTKRADACQGRINAALAADPSLKDAIDFGQFDAVPSSLVKPGEVVTPQNDLAEAILEHDKPTDLMRYLSEMPADMAALLASPNPRAFWRVLGQIEGRMAVPAKVPPKTITDAPGPPPTVGTRTSALSDVDAALKANDQASYEAARNRQRLAQMR